ncbi:heavy-metal-associated domain-containing protein [Thermoleptolyngbya sp. C42_A2020_037]|uniref:heavy-metal-associated domain-containing protein n=1 Tax=Thermoleptolyngbya sp. C42_A2020_037 TaxID=2747799 RepID=UPI0019F857E6|nr:heavy-metal-associated domain-containing protein [Thermoleptolyngbya sp. C42_A2020_037]MBF2084418.1 heavy-metal-associated domain-containing protein [Thermoleptolyngbya sp. C42_A2020_037]
MTYEFIVPDMACSACSDTITKAIQAIDAAATVQTDVKTKQVNVDTEAAEMDIRRAIAEAGYTIA